VKRSKIKILAIKKVGIYGHGAGMEKSRWYNLGCMIILYGTDLHL